MDRVDLSLELDLAEVRGEIQRRVDRVIAARKELADSLTDLNDGRAQVLDKSAAAVAFVDAFLNPLIDNPPPLAPEVAAPAPEVEPPVFTTVTEPEAAPTNTSGGAAPAVDPTNVVILPVEQPTENAVAADPVPADLAALVEAGVEAVAEHNAVIAEQAEAAVAPEIVSAEQAAADIIAAAEVKAAAIIAAAGEGEPRAPDAPPAAPQPVVEAPPVAVNVEAEGEPLTQKAPKGDPVEAAVADAANQPGGDPVGKPES